MSTRALTPVLAAIDVGTNAVRLELARPEADGSLETLHQERDPIRPGEGVFKTGVISREVADRLLSTLRRYAALCRRHRARVRAVATSALRDAKNQKEIVRRVKTEAGLDLEVVSGREEARLICMGVLHRKPPLARSLLIDIGGGSTEVAVAVGERPTDLWSLALGAVRLTDMFNTSGAVTQKQLRLLRGYTAEVLRKNLPERPPRTPKVALGSSGTINAVVAFAAKAGTGHATLPQLSRAVEQLVEMDPAQRRKRFDPRRADIVVAGAVILESVTRHLECESVAAVNRSLRDGLLVDLLHKQDASWEDHSLSEAALVIGRRFYFDEPHCRKVSELALALFDQLAPLHKLSSTTRPYLEVAALLHDVGNAVNYERHHKHTYYLIHNADIPGLTEREREFVAKVARYHRRSPPDLTHAGMEGLAPQDARAVRKLATLLRVADSLDRSHMQAVKQLKTATSKAGVTLKLQAKGPLDLELWNLEREFENFKKVYGKPLSYVVRK